MLVRKLVQKKEKTKYMFMFQLNEGQNHIEVANKFFEYAAQFKCLRITGTNRNCVHEIKRLNSWVLHTLGWSSRWMWLVGHVAWNVYAMVVWKLVWSRPFGWMCVYIMFSHTVFLLICEVLKFVTNQPTLAISFLFLQNIPHARELQFSLSCLGTYLLLNINL